MFELIIRHVNKTEPGLIGLESQPAKAIRETHVPATLKRDLLQTIWQKTGPEFLLSIGQEVRETQYDPIWRGACNSGSPEFLFEKWRRFEKFSHSTNRVHIVQDDPLSAQFQRHTVEGGTPTTPENLLICGLIIGLLEEIGCKDLRCEMEVSTGAVVCIRQNERFELPKKNQELLTDRWNINWRNFSPQTKTTTREIISIPVPAECDDEIRTFLQILANDISHQWKVEELAQEAGLSKRSLQRKLTAAGYSFSSLVRIVRVHEASALLSETDRPMTTIAFCSGFSDSAHFSRDFRTSMGMSPSKYRQGLKES